MSTWSSLKLLRSRGLLKSLVLMYRHISALTCSLSMVCSRSTVLNVELSTGVSLMCVSGREVTKNLTGNETDKREKDLIHGDNKWNQHHGLYSRCGR